MEKIGQKLGQEASNYSKGRYDHGEEVYKFIQKYLKPQDRILDMGCGTGIGTLGLLQHGFHHLAGCDIDASMLAEAKQTTKAYGFDIPFQKTSIETLSQYFAEKTFNAATAFSCFHWFCNKEALGEIRRVILDDGYFIVINKDDSGVFRKQFDAFLDKELQMKVPRVKKDYNPVKTITENGFKIVNEGEWDHVEEFPFERAVSYCQSICTWNVMDEATKRKMIPKLEQFVREISVEGMMQRPVRVSCIVAGKN